MSSLSAPSGVSLTVEPQSGLGLNLGPEEAVGLALWVGRERGVRGAGRVFGPKGGDAGLALSLLYLPSITKNLKSFPNYWTVHKGGKQQVPNQRQAKKCFF